MSGQLKIVSGVGCNDSNLACVLKIELIRQPPEEGKKPFFSLEVTEGGLPNELFWGITKILQDYIVKYTHDTFGKTEGTPN